MPQMHVPQGQYFIRSDYEPNEVNRSRDEISGDQYWTEARIAASARYQWDAYKFARAVAEGAAADTIVDLGCGVGTKLNRFFSGFTRVGVDQASAVEVAEQLYPGTHYYADNLDAPELDLKRLLGDIDLLICSDVIEHLEQPDKLLEYIRAQVTPSSTVVLTTPDRVSLHGPEAVRPVNPAHIREWARDEFCSFVQDHGFLVVEERLLRPFRFRVDWMTVTYMLDRVRRMRPLRFNHLVVCRVRR
jgi:SAM-dependent methyltransferase